MSVIHITDPDTYTKVRNQKASATNASGLVVIDMSASWCGPCKQIAPAYDKLAKMYENMVTFVHVDVETPSLMDEEDFQDVRGVPTFKFFKDGKKVDGFSGANIKKVQDLVEKHAN
jgi:thioredoxin